MTAIPSIMRLPIALRFDGDRSPFVNVDWIRRRLAFAPVVIEVRNSGELCESLLIDPLASSRRARLPAEDRKRCVAQYLGRAPLRAVGHAPVNGSPALDDGARPQGVGGNVVLQMLGREADCNSRHAELRDHVRDLAPRGLA